MNRHTPPASLLLTGLLAGCYSLPSSDDSSETGDSDGSTATTPSTMTNVPLPSGGTGSDGPGPTTSPTADTTSTPATDDGPETSDDTTSVDDDAIFVDDDTDPTAYTRVDRIGNPLVSTAMFGCDAPPNTCAQNDYNDAHPTGDSADLFLVEIIAGLNALHGGLNADFQGIEDANGQPFVVCSPVSVCRAQFESVAVPDVLALEEGRNGGFPNGRALSDPAPDVMFAVLMLDLTTGSNTQLAELPLSPPTNDVPFGATFPFLAPPH